MLSTKLISEICWTGVYIVNKYFVEEAEPSVYVCTYDNVTSETEDKAAIDRDGIMAHWQHIYLDYCVS